MAHILIVDDDLDIADTFRDLLQAEEATGDDGDAARSNAGGKGVARRADAWRERLCARESVARSLPPNAEEMLRRRLAAAKT